MRPLHALVSLQLLATRLTAATAIDLPPITNINIDPSVDPVQALTQLQQHAYQTLEKRDGVSKRASVGCSLATATKRRDW